MACSRLLSSGTNAVNLFNKLYLPIRSVSAASSIRRAFSTNSAYLSAVEDDNPKVDEDLDTDSSVDRLRDHDFCLDMFDPISPTQSMNQIFNMNNPLMPASRDGGLRGRRGWDAKEENESLSLRFDMLGLDIGVVAVEDNTLTIEAESKEEQPLVLGYSIRIDLPEDAYKMRETKVELKNGVLEIMVPKV